MSGAIPNRLRDRLQRMVSAAVGRPLTWGLVVALVAAWPIVWAMRTPLPPRLPVLGTVPPFELTAQDGRLFGSKDLAGRVWLASFFFTRCVPGCPAITRQMARIQGRTRNLEPAFHLVSISVDPGFDDPARLAAYAQAQRASPRMWTFLTGPVDAVRENVMRGLRVSRGRAAERPGVEDPWPVTQLMLVDGEGRIRGYYDPQEAGAVDRVVRDAALLVNRG
jgi:protein SCO1